jgi:hypothetical protein
MAPSAGARPTKYLILAALKNDEGRFVETAAEYLERSPAGRARGNRVLDLGLVGHGQSSSIATSRAIDGWAAWERHTTRSMPSWSHSRTCAGHGHGITSSSGHRR